ncbi:MAG: hypothetical protein VST71_00075 [Nitrospirota bacterium]|nr:hypothetical protein [Nitrospirota bacterium]
MKEQIISTFYHVEIELDFENVFSYCKFTESSLENEKVKFKEIYQAKVSELTADEKEDFDGFSIDIDWKLNDVFPALQWNSIFNSAYTMFETHMIELCQIFEKNISKEICLKDLKGKGIEQAKIFLSKVIGIKKVFHSTEWNEIQNYSKVRNLLVHASGKLDLTQKKHKSVFDYARKHPHLIVHPEDPGSGWAQLTILPDFIYEALLAYRIFLGKICKVQIPTTNG